MKNAFAVSSLILTVGYSAALAAEMIGVVSFRAPGFSTFISVYVATSVLTLAFGDYSWQTSTRSKHVSKPAPHRENAPALHPLSLPNSPLRTT